MVRKFDVRKVTVKLQTNSVDWDLVDALSWNSHNSPLDQVSNLAASPWKKTYTKQNLLQLFSSITFTQHFWYCCPKEDPQGCSVTRNTFIISQSEKTGSYRVISWVSLKRQNTPGTKTGRSDPAHPCWFTEEPRGPAGSGAHRRRSDSHTKLCSRYFLSYTELLLWEQTLPKCILSIEGDLRLNWGLKIRKKETRLHQPALPGRPFCTAHQGPAVASFPQDQPVETPTALAQDRILPVPPTAPGTWVTQQLTARGPPTLLPAHLFFKDYFKLTDKKASVFLNNFV